MKSLTHTSLSCLALSCLMLGGAPKAVNAQDMAINPYPSAETQESDQALDNGAFQPDQAVILELLARQAERKKRAGDAPVNLAAPVTRGQPVTAHPAHQNKTIVPPQPAAQTLSYQAPREPASGTVETVDIVPVVKTVRPQVKDQLQREPKVRPQPQPDLTAMRPAPSSIMGQVEEQKPVGRLTRKTIPITEWKSDNVTEGQVVSRPAEQNAPMQTTTKVIVPEDQKSILARVKPEKLKQPEWSVAAQQEVPPQPKPKLMPAPSTATAESAAMTPVLHRKRIVPTPEPSVQPAFDPQMARKAGIKDLEIDTDKAELARNNSEALYDFDQDIVVDTNSGAVTAMDAEQTFAPVNVESQIKETAAPVRKAKAVPVAEPGQTVPKAQSKVSALSNTMDAMQRQVSDLDAKSETVPAMVQEQALKRGLQDQAGAIVPTIARPDSQKDAVADLAAKITAENEMLAARQEDMIAMQQDQEQDLVLPVAPPQPVKDQEVMQQIASAQPQGQQQMNFEAASPQNPVPPGVQDLGGKTYVSPDNLNELETEFVDITTVSMPQKITPKWVGEKGESAYKILSQWSRNAGVDLIWNSQFLVDLNTDIAVNGSYEEAVQELLSQYQGRSAGVHGSLFVDEVSGRKTLVIETNQT